MSNDTEGHEEFPQTPASALLFQAPEFRAPAFQAPETPGDQGEDQGSPGRTGNQERKSADRRHQNDGEGDSKAEASTSPRGRNTSAKKDSGSSAKGSRGRNRSADETPAQKDGAEDSKSSATDNSSKGGKPTKQTRTPQPAAEKSGQAHESTDSPAEDTTSSTRRRRRRNRSDSDSGVDTSSSDSGDQVQSIKGSTRLEAKRMRRREGRKEGRRRHSITEAEFLARRESVDRQMIVRHEDGSDQVAVLEDGILVEHFVARKTNQSIVGNIYLGKVQNVLPSMEAAFVDIGRGRNAVLYAGEVNWDALGMQGKPRRIETALSSGDNVLVQVTKDPIGHKGARLTSQITLAGRYLVFVPGSTVLGISRKLPENERNRLKKALKEIVPEGAGVIVRTAAEGATAEQLTDDVTRLTGQWKKIEKKVATTRKAPVLLRGEPEMVVRVVRDLFNEDVGRLTVQGDETWETVHEYVEELSPELLDRLEKWTSKNDVFDERNIRSQLAKGMDRKVWLPSGGTLIIERTEALTVVDVNTGKFVGSGGTLEETVTRNNLEAAEEIVRQLRLRDIGGIIIIDFVDMVLEANRELVLRRLVESLGRDRTRHQVTEITSLGLVQMTRKRVGEGLVEAFSTSCEICEGRGRQHDARRRHSAPTEDRAPVSSHDSHVGDEKVKSALTAIAAATVGAHSNGETPPEPVQESTPSTSNRRARSKSGKSGSKPKTHDTVATEQAETQEQPRAGRTSDAKKRGPRVARAPQGEPQSRASHDEQEAGGGPDVRDGGKKVAPTSLQDIVLPAPSSEAKTVVRRPRRRAVVTGPVDTKLTRHAQAIDESASDGSPSKKTVPYSVEEIVLPTRGDAGSTDKTTRKSSRDQKPKSSQTEKKGAKTKAQANSDKKRMDQADGDSKGVAQAAVRDLLQQ